MSEDLKASCARFYDEVINGEQYELIEELIDEDFVEHEEFPGTSQDRDGIRQFFTLMRAAFPDLRAELHQMIAEGDEVVVRATMHGTHEGEFMGVPASGNEIAAQMIDIVRFDGGKVAEHWGLVDGMAMMEQIGAIDTEQASTA